MLKVTQQVLTRRLAGETVIASALDTVALVEGIPISNGQRSTLISFFKQLSLLPQAAGYQVQLLDPREVRLRAVFDSAASDEDPVPPTRIVTGTVQQRGDTPRIRTSDPEWKGEVAPDAIIRRDGVRSTLADLEDGDAVTAVVGLDGSAVQINALRAEPWWSDWRRWLLFLAPFLLISFIGIRRSRRRAPFVIEPRPMTASESRPDRRQRAA